MTSIAIHNPHMEIIKDYWKKTIFQFPVVEDIWGTSHISFFFPYQNSYFKILYK